MSSLRGSHCVRTRTSINPLYRVEWVIESWAKKDFSTTPIFWREFPTKPNVILQMITCLNLSLHQFHSIQNLYELQIVKQVDQNPLFSTWKTTAGFCGECGLLNNETQCQLMSRSGTISLLIIWLLNQFESSLRVHRPNGLIIISWILLITIKSLWNDLPGHLWLLSPVRLSN